MENPTSVLLSLSVPCPLIASTPLHYTLIAYYCSSCAGPIHSSTRDPPEMDSQQWVRSHEHTQLRTRAVTLQIINGRQTQRVIYNWFHHLLELHRGSVNRANRGNIWRIYKFCFQGKHSKELGYPLYTHIMHVLMVNLQVVHEVRG